MAQSFWWTTSGQAALRHEMLGEVEPGWCLVEAHCSAISPGTERLVARGEVPASLHDAMRCPYMGGEFSFPVKYGYSLVGEVRQGPVNLMGRLVHVLHPHQSEVLVRVDDTFEVPEGVPAARATLAGNMETAVTALWDGEVSIGDRALVIGFGVIGSLVARLLKGVAGVEVLVADVDPEKLLLARDMGFDAVHPEELSAGFDVAFHASASSAGLQTALDMIGFEGRVVELSWYGDRSTQISLGASFHSQRKSIVSSQVSHIPPGRRARWDRRRRKALVFRLLADPAFDAHLTGQTRFDVLPSWFADALEAPPAGLAHLVVYR